MNKLTFISQIELLGFKQERQLTWIKREIEKHLNGEPNNACAISKWNILVS